MSESISRIPKIVWIITPLLAVAFVTFLFFLKTVPSGDELEAVKGDAKKVLQTGVKRAQEEARKEVEKQVSKPAYDFYKLLKDSDVPVPSADKSHYTSTPKSDEAQYQYSLQAASFRSNEQADSLKVKLIMQNLESSIVQVSVKGTPYYRVMVGPFTDRSKMNKAQDILVDYKINALVIKKPIK
ncbi:MAG: cell division protein FtsN [Oleispira sp.]|jgi:cell division protein FtsN